MRDLVTALVKERGGPVEVMAHDLDRRDWHHGAWSPEADSRAKDRRSGALVLIDEHAGNRLAGALQHGRHAQVSQPIEIRQGGAEQWAGAAVYRIAEEIERRVDLHVATAKLLDGCLDLRDQRRVLTGPCRQPSRRFAKRDELLDDHVELLAERCANVALD